MLQCVISSIERRWDLFNKRVTQVYDKEKGIYSGKGSYTILVKDRKIISILMIIVIR